MTGLILGAVGAAPAAAADGTWVLTDVRVNPDGADPPVEYTDLVAEEGYVAWTYLDARPGYDGFAARYEAAHDPFPDELAPGETATIEIAVEGTITRGDDVRHTGMGVFLSGAGASEEAVGVEQTCTAPEGVIECDDPATNTGTRTITAPASGETFTVTFGVYNCSACAAVYTYQFESAQFEPAPEAAREITVVSVNGDVSVKRAGEDTYSQLAAGDTLAVGDSIATDVDSEVVLEFGENQRLTVHELTPITINRFLLEADVAKTQIRLDRGYVDVDVEANLIRSDFSVVTPTVVTSIRGSAMTVTHDDDAGVTTVLVTEHEAFATPAAGGEEITLAEGEETAFDENGIVAEATTAAAAIETTDDEGGGSPLPLVAVIATVGVIGAALVILVRRQTA